MKFIYLINLCVFIFVNASNAQIKFETSFSYSVLKDGRFYSVESHEGHPYVSKLIKHDEKYVDFTGTEIIDFIFRNIDNKTLNAFTKKGGVSLSDSDIHDKLYFYDTITCEYCEAPFYDLVELSRIGWVSRLKIYQEWTIDTMLWSIKNKISGIEFYCIDFADKKEELMFYVPFKNNYSKGDLVNNSNVTYIQKTICSINWKFFPKESILKFISEYEGIFYQDFELFRLRHLNRTNLDNNRKAQNNFGISKSRLYTHLLKTSEAFGFSEYIYLDFANKTVNSQLIYISPKKGEYDENGKFAYRESIFWIGLN